MAIPDNHQHSEYCNCVRTMNTEMILVAIGEIKEQINHHTDISPHIQIVPPWLYEFPKEGQ